MTVLQVACIYIRNKLEEKELVDRFVKALDVEGRKNYHLILANVIVAPCIWFPHLLQGKGCHHVPGKYSQKLGLGNCQGLSEGLDPYPFLP